ncbi:putative 3-deoxy-D-manno-octulosonate 8-phosphate phosphatase, YrbI family [Variovorax paradoxus B4]|uniref:3-deoxy-D-manno-octulosonate 8-phosphate phosphatase KdsC n=1 Tax=Variovorax paradoxus B4 TaxID=1246301 RepID=T1XJ25_VARPD|nr:HAD hydrolase family protein [Variovorax paradoxus]AGU52556.1 putative 3-deoxy-D-manno-octulosonate 8-phosphate phosphatase, YrbI family [Variovorax paradoxus B4]
MPLDFQAETLLAAQDVRIAFFDIDGVLTDGGVYFTEHGETLKRFSILDGYGLRLLRLAGITPAVITGRDSKPLRVRLEALGIQHVRYGTEDKLPAAQAMLEELGFSWLQAAAIGDDWPDLPVLARVGFAAAPANAHVEVRDAVNYVTRARGGEGAAREFCDLLLTAGGHYQRLLDAARGPRQ